MYKAIIADDEELTREGLKGEIDWGELGIEIVAEADNGLTALELIKTWKPDILLCDIRMPKMDGIELTNYARRLFPDMQIIFLSAYSDKEYLKSAIQVKAMDYLEKPFEANDLLNIMKKTVSELDETKNQRKNLEVIHERLKSNIFYFKQKSLLNILEGISDIRFQADAPGLQKDSAIRCIVIKINLNNNSSNYCRVIRNSIPEIVMNVMEERHTDDWLGGFVDHDQIALCVYGSISTDRTGVMELLDHIKATILTSFPDITLSIGVGQKQNNILNASTSFKQATDASERQFYLGFQRIFFWDDSFPAKKYVFNPAILHDIHQSLTNHDISGLIGIIEQVSADIDECKDLDTAYIKNVYFSVLLRLYEWLMNEEVSVNETELNGDYLWNDYLMLNTLPEIKAYVLGEIQTLEAHLKADNASNKTNTVDEIKAYIEKNYSKDITIMSIAEHLYLTHTYLCLVFKKATGNTINQYITDFRIEKAKQLLKGKQLPMEFVAEKTGFKNAKYFSRVFKKRTGQNPSDYKGRIDE